jgi:tape measure domain-containing protein
MVSSGLVKMANTARSTSASIKGVNGTLSQSYDQVRRKIGELESAISKSTSISHIRAARRELEQLQRVAARHPGGVASGGGGGLGIMAMARNYLGPLAIAGAIGGVFGAGAQKEQDIVGLRTFLGQQGAEQVYSNVQQDAARTPFSVAGLLQVNRALISAGVNADAARQDTLNLANAVAAVGGGNDVLSRMAANMQQIKTVGKATAMDIRQFAMTGINIYQLLATATGKSIDQVKEMDVSYDLLSDALNRAAQAGGLYAGAMDAQSQTVTGRFSTLRDVISLGAAEMGTALQPLMHGLIDLGMLLVNTIVPAAVQTVNWIKENWSWLSALVAIIGGATAGYYAYVLAMQGVALATQVWTGVQWLLNAAMTANPIGLIIVAIGALVAGIIWAYNNFEGFRKTILSIWEVLKVLFQPIINHIIWQFKLFVKLVNVLKDAFLWLWDVFKDIFIKIRDHFAQVFAPIINAVKWLLGKAGSGGFGKTLADAWNRGQQAGSSVSASAPGGSSLTNAITPGKPVGAGAGDEAVKGITGGGPRVINIQIDRMVERLEIHTTQLSEGLGEVERKVEEVFLRILNSGAAVQ